MHGCHGVGEKKSRGWPVRRPRRPQTSTRRPQSRKSKTRTRTRSTMATLSPNGYTSADVTTTNPTPPRFPHPQKPPPTIKSVGLESKLQGLGFVGDHPPHPASRRGRRRCGRRAFPDTALWSPPKSWGRLWGWMHLPRRRGKKSQGRPVRRPRRLQTSTHEEADTHQDQGAVATFCPNGYTSADVTATNPKPTPLPHPQKPPPTIKSVGLESKLQGLGFVGDHPSHPSRRGRRRCGRRAFPGTALWSPPKSWGRWWGWMHLPRRRGKKITRTVGP